VPHHFKRGNDGMKLLRVAGKPGACHGGRCVRITLLDSGCQPSSCIRGYPPMIENAINAGNCDQ
jgi:hypothetical protein